MSLADHLETHPLEKVAEALSDKTIGGAKSEETSSVPDVTAPGTSRVAIDNATVDQIGR